MEDRWWDEWKEAKEVDRDYTAAAIQAKLKEIEVKQHIDLMKRAEEYCKREEEERLKRAPQEAMDKFLGGAPYEEVLDLIKATYPERFI